MSKISGAISIFIDMFKSKLQVKKCHMIPLLKYGRGSSDCIARGCVSGTMVMS